MSIVEKEVWDRILDKNNADFESDFNAVLKVYLDYAEAHLKDHDREGQELRRTVIWAFKKRTKDPEWVANLRVPLFLSFPEQQGARWDKFWKTLQAVEIADDWVDIYRKNGRIDNPEYKSALADFFNRLYCQQKDRLRKKTLFHRFYLFVLRWLKKLG